MNLYLISQTADCRYDTYDSAVVAAYDEAQARLTHPDGSTEGCVRAWVPPHEVTVQLIGKASPGTQPGVICASFNAG